MFFDFSISLSINLLSLSLMTLVSFVSVTYLIFRLIQLSVSVKNMAHVPKLSDSMRSNQSSPSFNNNARKSR